MLSYSKSQTLKQEQHDDETVTPPLVIVSYVKDYVQISPSGNWLISFYVNYGLSSTTNDSMRVQLWKRSGLTYVLYHTFTALQSDFLGRAYSSVFSADDNFLYFFYNGQVRWYNISGVSPVLTQTVGIQAGYRAEVFVASKDTNTIVLLNWANDGVLMFAIFNYDSVSGFYVQRYTSPTILGLAQTYRTGIAVSPNGDYVAVPLKTEAPTAADSQQRYIQVYKRNGNTYDIHAGFELPLLTYSGAQYSNGGNMPSAFSIDNNGTILIGRGLNIVGDSYSYYCAFRTFTLSGGVYTLTTTHDDVYGNGLYGRCYTVDNKVYVGSANTIIIIDGTTESEMTIPATEHIMSYGILGNMYATVAYPTSENIAQFRFYNKP